MAEVVTEVAQKIPGLSSLPKSGQVAVVLAGAAGAGYVAYRYLTRSKKASSTPGDVGPEYGDDFSDPGGAGRVVYGQPPEGETGDPTGIQTDSDWIKAAIDNMLAVGYTDTAMVSRVLGAWLANRELANDGEVTIVQTAVGLTGRPPSGDRPYRVKPAEPSNPAPSNPAPEASPAAPRTYTLQSPMNVKQAAGLIYGSSAWDGWGGRLYWHNEWNIVTAARAAGVNANFADYKLPAGFTLNLL